MEVEMETGDMKLCADDPRLLRVTSNNNVHKNVHSGRNIGGGTSIPHAAYAAAQSVGTACDRLQSYISVQKTLAHTLDPFTSTMPLSPLSPSSSSSSDLSVAAATSLSSMMQAEREKCAWSHCFTQEALSALSFDFHKMHLQIAASSSSGVGIGSRTTHSDRSNSITAMIPADFDAAVEDVKKRVSGCHHHVQTLLSKEQNLVQNFTSILTPAQIKIVESALSPPSSPISTDHDTTAAPTLHSATVSTAIVTLAAKSNALSTGDAAPIPATTAAGKSRRRRKRNPRYCNDN